MTKKCSGCTFLKKQKTKKNLKGTQITWNVLFQNFKTDRAIHLDSLHEICATLMELSNQEVKPFRQEKHQAHWICDRYRHLLKKISNSKSGYPAVAFIADIYIFELWAGWLTGH